MTPDFIYLLVKLGENGFQGGKIAVNVSDESDPHRSVHQIAQRTSFCSERTWQAAGVLDSGNASLCGTALGVTSTGDRTHREAALLPDRALLEAASRSSPLRV
jgi:hypothetical protein